MANINPYLLNSLQDPDITELLARFAPYLEDDQGQQPQYGPPVPQQQVRGIEEWQPQPAEEGPGVLGHVSHFLSYFNRPNAALWSAVKAAQEGRSAWEGAGRGLYGEEDTGLADVLGMPEGQATDEWLPWLGKEIPRFAVSAAGDPLNAFFAPIKGASLAARGAKALGSDTLRKGLYSSGAAKYFARGLPEDLFPEFTSRLAESNRLLGHKQLDIRDLADAGYGAIKKEHPDMSWVELNEAYARTPEMLGPETLQALDALKGVAGQGRESLNEALGRFNLPEVRIAPEGPGTGRVNWTPRPDTEQGQRLLSRQAARQGMTPEPFMETEFVRLVDPQALEQGIISSPVGLEAPFVTKKQFLNDMAVEGMPNTYAFKGGMVEGVPIPATSKDIAEAADLGLLGKKFTAGAQVQDPVAAFAIDATRKAKQERYLSFLDTLKGEDQVRYLKGGGEIPGGWREVNVPRMAKTAGAQEGEAGVKVIARKAVANQLETLATKHFDPSTPIGGIGSTMQHFFEGTAPGQAISRFKNLFNATTLPLHPGFHVGNKLSNLGLLYESGQNPLQMVSNQLAAANVMRGAGESLGVSNSWLKRELAARGVGSSSWSGSLAGDALEEARRSPTFAGIPGLEQIGEAGHKATQAGYKFGQGIEEMDRTAAVLGYLKKNHPDFGTLDDATKATVLDRAAEFAKNALVNYDVTPFERQLSNVIPYLSWQKGIASRTGELALTKPQRLNRFGQALDTFLEPLSEEDKQTADPWIRESMPISGAFGGKLPESGGLPGMGLVGRGVPQGDLDRILGRPLDYLASSVLAPMKLPVEAVSNRNFQKGVPLDSIADGFPGNFINALLDKPTQLADEKTLGARLPMSWRTALSELPGGRYLNELNTAGRTAGAWEDLTKPEMTPLEALLWYGTGGKNFPFDQAKYLRNRTREAAQQRSAIKSQAKYFAGKGDEEATQFMLEALAAAASRNPVEGRW